MIVNQDHSINVDESEALKRKREELQNTIVHQDGPKEILNDIQPTKKKKKEFVGKTNFVNDDAFEDILESGWFYIDSYGNPQGPFSSKEMKEWFIAGFFFENTMVKRINDVDYQPISSCEEFMHCELSSNVVSTDIYNQQTMSSKTSQQAGYDQQESYQKPYNSIYTDPSLYQPPDIEQIDKEPFTQTAFFNTHSGRFTPVSSYYAAKGIPEDREGRMLSHYLDIEAYQEQMRAAKANPDTNARPKVSKKMIAAFKKKKVDKQRRRILMM